MSINDFLAWLNAHNLATAAVLVAVPLAAVLWSLLHRRENSARSPWKQGYAVLAYLACIPGMFAAVLVAYGLFFTHQNLLNANALVYFLPLATMAASLVIIRRRVAFAELPGFGRLGGLMLFLGLSFGLALAIDRTRIFVGFFGSIDRLFVLVAAIFVLLKAGFWLAFGRRKPD